MRIEILIIITIILIIVSCGILLLNLYEFIKNDTLLITPIVKVKAGNPFDLKINVNKYDRIYLILNANITVSEIYIQPRDMLISLPLDVEGLEYDVAYPIILQRSFFFIANSSGSARFTFILQPQIPYAIKSIEGEVESNIIVKSDYESIIISFKVKKFAQNNYSQVLLIHPYGEKAEADFQVKGSLSLFEGKIAYVNLILMTENGEWYAFRVAPEATGERTVEFNINANSRELFGRNGQFLGKRILFVAIGIGFYKGQWDASEEPYAKMGIGNLYIQSHGVNYTIKAQVINEYDFKPRIYIFRKFTPCLPHVLLVTALAAEVAALTYLALRWLRS